MGSTIDSYITHGVTLGSGTYTTALTITQNGTIGYTGTGQIALSIPSAYSGLPVYNYGLIAGGTVGVSAQSGGTIVNEAGGTISGGNGGVYLNTPGTIINAGSIDGGTGTGVFGFGYETNSGRITGREGAYFRGTFGNSGTIIGSGAGGIGVYMGVSAASGSALMTNSGTIYGTAEGVKMRAGGTLVNAGTIGGGTAAVYFAGYAGPALLVADPGAVFFGLVTGTNTESTLELAGGTMAGVLDMGGSFSGFNTFAIDINAAWTLEGDESELAAGQTITGFSADDTLVLEGFTATSSFVSGNQLILSDGTTTETLRIERSNPSQNFVISDVAAGTEVVTVCYVKGTRILTLRGEVVVERLGLGDMVVTRFGGAREVKWIGRQHFIQPFLGRQAERLPVRIQAGALGGGRPKRHLSVSPGRSLLLGETLVLAKHLINGVTITQDDAGVVEYYNIELATHDCVLAEGAWAETYADAPGLRAQFHNAAEFRALYPDHAEAQELLLCAPRPGRGTALEAALMPVAVHAAAHVTPGGLRGFIDAMAEDGLVMGWAQDMAHPALPVLLEFVHQNEVIGTALACQYRADVEAAGHGSGRCGFAFQAPAGAQVTVRRAADGAALVTATRLAA